ncbi:MAG: hypothetical protein IKB64_09805 [Paludibacteraceae bacterium]|nr:hypothetical protein [Paludibacteraceae bacterium]
MRFDYMIETLEVVHKIATGKSKLSLEEQQKALAAANTEHNIFKLFTQMAVINERAQLTGTSLAQLVHKITEEKDN